MSTAELKTSDSRFQSALDNFQPKDVPQKEVDKYSKYNRYQLLSKRAEVNYDLSSPSRTLGDPKKIMDLLKKRAAITKQLESKPGRS